MISTPFWKREYNGDPRVLGKTLNIEGVVSTIVRVMPAGFAPFFGYRLTSHSRSILRTAATMRDSITG